MHGSVTSILIHVYYNECQCVRVVVHEALLADVVRRNGTIVETFAVHKTRCCLKCMFTFALTVVYYNVILS